MANNEIITLQFGNYSNFIGAHWWNLQENSFVYTSDTPPEINFDVLFREGQNYRKEVTFTPRLLLTDLKGSLGSYPEQNDLYEEISLVDVTKNFILWPNDKIQIEHAPKYKRNEFLEDLENQEIKMNDEDTLVPFEKLTSRYELDDKVHFWSDYLGTRFHPRTMTVINEYQHDFVNHTFNTYCQGTELWKTDTFFEEWSDKCRAYAEECDYLQGFQMLFDCIDGFSGLSCCALAHLQDEFPNKSILSFPSVASWYSGGTGHQNNLRIINSILSFSELIDLSSAFVPLSTNYDAWNESGIPRKFHNIHYDDKLPYHTSATLAAFLDTVSISYRLRKNINTLSSLLSNLSPCGRKLLSGTLRLPFPVYPDLSILECLESLESPFWTTLTPNLDITVDCSDVQELNTRGLSSFRLLPSSEKCAPNTNQCQTVEDLLYMYLEFCSSSNRKMNAKINSIEMPLKIPRSFPNIFNNNVTRIGCVSSSDFSLNFAVAQSPVLAGLHNSSSTSCLLTHLHEKASKINLRQLHHFFSLGFENLEYSESLEKLLTLNDNYV